MTPPNSSILPANKKAAAGGSLMNKVLTNALSGKSNDPKPLIALIRHAAKQEMGEPKPNASEGERAIYEANLEHATSVALGKLNAKAAQALRWQAWDIYTSGKWIDVRLPILDPISKQPIYTEEGLIEFESFNTFSDWFWRVASDSGLDRSITTNTESCITNLLPNVQRGMVTDGGKPITVADVMKINRANLEVMTGSVNKILNEYTLSGDVNLLGKVGTIISDAIRLTRDELKLKLSAQGLRGTKLRTMACYTSTLPNDTTAYTILANPSQARFIEEILSGRLVITPTTPDELPDLIRRGAMLPIEQAAQDSSEPEPFGTSESYDIAAQTITPGDAQGDDET